MKILFIVPQPFLEIRGSPLAVKRIVGGLSGIGHDVHLLAYHLGSNVEIKGVKIIRIPAVPFVKRVPIGPSWRKFFLDLILFAKAFYLLLTGRYDAIHAVEEAGYLSVPLSKLFGKPLIYDMDSIIPDQLLYTSFIKNRILLSFVKAIERWTIRNAKVVVSVCQEITDHVKSIEPGKAVVQIEDVPEVGDTGKEAEAEAHNLREKLGLDGKPVCAYIGNFEPYQGVELLLRSAEAVTKELPDSRFLIVGGNPADVDGMKLFADRLGIGGKVIFLGQRPVEELPVFLKIADVLASPRIKGTNTPMKVYSYMWSGKPIVATRLPTHTQVLNDQNSLLVEPEPQAMAEGFLRAFRDKSLGSRLGEAAQREVKAKFHASGIAGKLKQAYSYLGNPDNGRINC